MKIKNSISILIIALFISVIFVFFGKSVFASTTDGTIDPIYKYAWGENTGWINFGATNGNVHITDSGFSGYGLSENVGWINLADVVNDGEGNLSGYAWSENTGWIKFNPANGGVIINSLGEFTGSALGENIGWIIFGGDYKVKTDWRPQSTRIPPNVSIIAPAAGSYLRGSTVSITASSSDNIAVASLQFKLDGSNLGSLITNPSSPYSISWNTILEDEGSHTLRAVVIDSNGNIATSAPIAVTVDNSAPTISLTAPSDGAFIHGSFINVTATTSDNIGVFGVQFKLDNTNLEAEDIFAPYAISWNTVLTSDGAHTLTAVARDSAGNITTSSPISVTVDNEAPTVSFLVPADGSVVSGASVNISAYANDNIGVIGVQYKLDGINFKAEQTVYPYSISWDTTIASSGSHTLLAIARDAAGNITTSSPVLVTVDNIAPTISITSPTAGATVSGLSVAVIATTSDNVGVAGVQFKLDGANLGTEIVSAPYSIIWDSTQVSDGAHLFTAIARDFAGHETESTAVAITVHNAPAPVPPATGGGGFHYDLPFPPLGGFKIFINDNAAETNSIFVTLNLAAGNDSVKMAISNTADFNNSDQEPYQPTKIWNICKGLSSCEEGEHIVYVKFYNVFGMSSGAVFAGIIYNTSAVIVKPIVVPPVIVPPVVKPGEPAPITKPGTTPITEPVVTVPPKKPVSIIPPVIGNIITPVIKGIGTIIQPIIPIINGIFNPPSEVKPPEIPIEQVVNLEAPLSLKGQWTLIDSSPLREFALAPLPNSLINLAKEFPQLDKIFQEVGVEKITDVSKLSGVSLTLPGLSESAGVPQAEVEPGKFALPKGIPLAELSATAKAKIPTNIVFADAAAGLIDIQNTLTLNNKGDSELTTSVISGQKMHLTIKPDFPAKGVTGYVVFRSRDKVNVSSDFNLEDLMASALFASPAFAQEQAQPVPLEEKLVLSQFDYQDAGDGIFTADINAPVVDGQYEIISVINYVDQNMAPKAVSMIAVVDPEGYVYEANNGKETRIPGAVISLYWLNPETSKYELWPAKDYQQENNQVTDVSGVYSFLVPPGTYYLQASAPGYLSYEGKPFEVAQGGGIHDNIQMKPKFWWLSIFDWKTLLLVIVALFLLYNFYRDKLRDVSRKNKK
jgi:Protein of unknown function (DUF3607).